MAQSILIVDDEKEIVSMLYCYFSKLGYTVYTATAGNAALKEVEKQPDIILLDVNMPDIDGFTVCERIRDYVSCPIIFLTARISHDVDGTHQQQVKIPLLTLVPLPLLQVKEADFEAYSVSDFLFPVQPY